MSTVLIGALLSLTFPIFSFILYNGLFACNKINYKVLIFSTSIFAALIAYVYVPIGETDLTRYFNMIDRVKHLGFVETITYNNSGDFALYSFNFLMWLCKSAGNYHFLPAITTFIVFYISLTYIFSYSAEYISYKKMALYYIVILLCFNWKSLANNVRNVTALLIASYAVFIDAECNKKSLWTYVLYTFSIFLHPTAVLIILLRVALVIKSRARYILLFFAILSQPIVIFLYQSFYAVIPFGPIKTVLYLGNKYFTDTNSAWGVAVQSSIVQHITRILSLILAALFIVLYIRNNKLSTVNCKNNFQKFAFYLAITTLACAPIITPAYWRFSYCSIAANSNTFLDNLNSSKRGTIDQLAIFGVVTVSILLFMVGIWRDRNDIANVFLSDSFILTIPIIEIIKGIFNALKMI